MKIFSTIELKNQSHVFPKVNVIKRKKKKNLCSKLLFKHKPT